MAEKGRVVMNAYYSPEENKDIGRASLPKITFNKGTIEFLCSIVAFFTCDIIVKIAKVTVSAICFIAFFGIAGGMDSGSIGVLKGTFLCACCVIAEIFILRSLSAHAPDDMHNI